MVNHRLVDCYQLFQKKSSCEGFYMEINIPINRNISLKVAKVSKSSRDYPTARLQKGLLLVYDGQELVEEGVGFGVPILKQGLHTIFPGDLSFSSQRTGRNQIITALFKMNLEERITTPRNRSIENKQLYSIKNYLAAMIRNFPMSRNLLTAVSNRLRFMFNWETVYKETRYYREVKVIYTIDRIKYQVRIDLDTVGALHDCITEVIVMNEQGARYFDRYQDSDGYFLRENEIGCWDEVTADEASFVCDQYRLAYNLRQVKGARLFRGRELIGTRLAWSGFGYSFTPTDESFIYELRIKQLP